ncbi:peptidoglycan DD-metalloendopeptidase family protein [Chitinophaga sp. SYP-B3965]|uniref:peptidoglycan DD-metalloendopeptidase family protein n=1 Tax=Chitinophaga sp. SYP-B3965 TaxID=2663120 RepID=UPI001299A4AB|nr:peptidoglycan DD-metalloendopeptidase family protein [Chitinophaga sp. SYP-B3965]MRG48694.1 peptidoglycan DD-metalloendopeptidase family protein [Chitinophaga sp. SYP-B3965]
MKRTIAFLLLLPQLLQAQGLAEKQYPKGYFRNPLNIPIELAGNFGELRPNHFHSGMDLKTQQRENLPVHAAADGYVSRIGVSHLGFGNVLYITHPNGYTTVYAHLNKFYPLVDEYVKRKQYEQESWASDIVLPQGLFPVKKGDFVAWSGNTGGSAGPHLHFEIRDTQTEKPLNPMLFGFSIPDTRAPEISRLVIYDRNKSLYEQSPIVVPVKNTKTGYVATRPIVKVATDKVSLGLSALDRQSNSMNPNGIYEAMLIKNGQVDCGFQLDNISYDETRYLNAHIDYKMKKAGGPYVQLLFALPGNHLDIYQDVSGNGTIDLSDKQPHPVTIRVTDAYGNATNVQITLQQEGSSSPEPVCANKMFADSRNIFENNQVEFYLEEGSLYDQICFRYLEIPNATAYSSTYRLHTALVPVHYSFGLRIKPNRPVPAVLQNKMIIVRKGLGESVSATTFEDGWYKGTFRDLGDFYLTTDTEAPRIAPLGSIKQGANLSKAGKISFSMNDASGIKSYRAELDGKWIMFSRRSNVLSYTFDEHCLPGNHTVTLTVTDIANNESTYTLTFKR